MMGGHRPIAALALLLLGAGANGVSAGSAPSGSTYYSGTTAQPADTYGRQPGYGGGSYRPADSPNVQWQGSSAGDGGAAWSPSAGPRAGNSAWNSQWPAQPADSRSGYAERPLGEYRFRQRPEDKAKKTEEALRYRPDPELARRSQQFRGIHGQDPSLYGGGPAAVFRPLQSEQEPNPVPARPGMRPPEPAQAPWSDYPAGPYSGYGYPY